MNSETLKNSVNYKKLKKGEKKRKRKNFQTFSKKSVTTGLKSETVSQEKDEKENAKPVERCAKMETSKPDTSNPPLPVEYSSDTTHIISMDKVGTVAISTGTDNRKWEWNTQ